MAVKYSPATQEFLRTLEGEHLEITYALLKIVEGIGIKVEARFYKNIIIINRDGLDLWGISPSKGYYNLYLFNPEAKDLFLPRLGKIDEGFDCLRFKHWDDLNPEVMAEMFRWMLENPVNRYGNISGHK